MPEEWNPTNKELEVIVSVCKKVKVTYEKIKEKTTETENIF